MVFFAFFCNLEIGLLGGATVDLNVWQDLASCACLPVAIGG